MYPTSRSLHVGKPSMCPSLCLALKGVPVKPTDDVDVDKEYQLIPLDSL